MLEVNQERRAQLIADAAYLRAERRGFNGGDPVADWLEAETEVDAQLRNGKDVLGRLEERLAAASQSLQAFKKKLAGMTSEARYEWKADVEKLAKLRDRFRTRIKEIREQGEHATEKAKQQAEKISNEISELIERLRSHGS